MTVSQTPAPARSDLTVGTPTSGAVAARPFLKHGALLSAGAVAWAAAIAVIGLDPGTRFGEMAFSLGSGLFQLGVLALLRVLWRTNALGSGKLAKAALLVETALLTLAIGSTIADGVGLSDLTQPGWLLLDLFWPLSMLGMFFIGIRIAVAGRWTGPARFWPMIAESWAVVTVPSLMIFGPAAAQVIGACHLLIGYTVLGILVTRKSA